MNEDQYLNLQWISKEQSNQENSTKMLTMSLHLQTIMKKLLSHVTDVDEPSYQIASKDIKKDAKGNNRWRKEESSSHILELQASQKLRNLCLRIPNLVAKYADKLTQEV